MGDKIGKITEAAGRVTGDREVEAKGRVEQDASDGNDSEADITDEAIENEKQVVRREHGDIDSETS
ncbi:MAG: CsbD family protein [Actinomycetota bacterium]|nr:CsbD family protein [Actinomycetota bacterium]